MVDSGRTNGLRPRWCPQCGTALVIGHDGTRERRGCRRCGWIYEPTLTVQVVTVIEQGASLVVVAGRPPHLPASALAWAETPETAATRTGHEQTGLRVVDPRFLGFVHTSDAADPERFVLSLCYVLQSEESAPSGRSGIERLRLGSLTGLAQPYERYALDAYRAWLDRRL